MQSGKQVKKYTVTIFVEKSKSFDVEANDHMDALNKGRELYNTGGMGSFDDSDIASMEARLLN